MWPDLRLKSSYDPYSGTVLGRAGWFWMNERQFCTGIGAGWPDLEKWM
jgi:hypothetical protein